MRRDMINVYCTHMKFSKNKRKYINIGVETGVSKLEESIKLEE